MCLVTQVQVDVSHPSCLSDAVCGVNVVLAVGLSTTVFQVSAGLRSYASM